MNQPLLTVIVPCYNVEKYADKCIASIVGQTYTDLEILLIDDGSTDNSGKICDAWQAKDSRIRVIHKQNEGLPYARKTGVENATAEYLTFVDADDWIDRNMYSDMMFALLSTSSDIAYCDLCKVYEDGHMEHRVYERCAAIQTMGRIEGVIMILKDHGRQTSLGTKIFKKKLFEHIEFPKGRVYGEDMIIHDLFHYASKSVFIDKEYYYYFQRRDSISNRQGDIWKEMKNLGDFSNAYYERYSFVNRHPEYHSVLPQVKRTTICMGINLLRNMIVFPQYFTNEYFTTKAKQLSSISLTKKDRLRRSVKSELYVLKISPKCYQLMRWLYVRVIVVTNKLKLTNRPTFYLINDGWS